MATLFRGPSWSLAAMSLGKSKQFIHVLQKQLTCFVAKPSNRRKSKQHSWGETSEAIAPATQDTCLTEKYIPPCTLKICTRSVLYKNVSLGTLVWKCSTVLQEISTGTFLQHSHCFEIWKMFVCLALFCGFRAGVESKMNIFTFTCLPCTVRDRFQNVCVFRFYCSVARDFGGCLKWKMNALNCFTAQGYSQIPCILLMAAVLRSICRSGCGELGLF